MLKGRPARCRIKICGLSRPEDIGWVNEAQPDYAGFIVNVPNSKRNVPVEMLYALCSHLRGCIVPVGVFVNEPAETIVSLAENGILGMVQLHGSEDENYIKKLQKQIAIPVLKAFRIDSPEAVLQAEKSSADYILLDNGSGGTGHTFDWSLLQHMERPFFLAGGLGPNNLERAVKTVRPWAVDMSSGVETNGVKDKTKIFAAVAAVRRCER